MVESLFSIYDDSPRKTKKKKDDEIEDLFPTYTPPVLAKKPQEAIKPETVEQIPKKIISETPTSKTYQTNPQPEIASTGDPEKDAFIKNVIQSKQTEITPSIEQEQEEIARQDLIKRVVPAVKNYAMGFAQNITEFPYKALKGVKQMMDYKAKKYAEENPVEMAKLIKESHVGLTPEEIEMNKEKMKGYFKSVGDFTKSIQYDAPDNIKDKFSYKFGAGSASLLESLVPGAIAMVTWGDSFDEAIAQGKTEEEAAKYADTQAILQEASERLGSFALGKIIKEGGKLGFKAGKAFASEAMQETSQEALAMIAEKAFGIEPGSPAMQRFLDAFFIGGLTGAGSTFVASPIQKAHQAVKERNKEDLAEAVADGDERKIFKLLKEQDKLAKEEVELYQEPEQNAQVKKIEVDQELNKQLPTQEELDAQEQTVVEPEVEAKNLHAKEEVVAEEVEPLFEDMKNIEAKTAKEVDEKKAEVLKKEVPVKKDLNVGVKEATEYFKGKNPDLDVEFIDTITLQDQVDQGIVTEKDAMKAIKAAGLDIAPKDAVIYGMNYVETKDKFARDVIKLSKNEADITTVIEENAELYYKKEIDKDKDFELKINGLRKEYEQATGETSEQADIEWFSDRAIDYAVHGQIHKETGFKLKEILNRFKDYAREVLKRAGQLRKNIKAGKINQELVTELDKAVFGVKDKAKKADVPSVQTVMQPSEKASAEKEKGVETFQLRKAERPDISTIEEKSKQIRSLIGKKASLKRMAEASGEQEVFNIGALRERNDIQNRLDMLKDEVNESIRRAVIKYAQATGLRGEPFNMVDVMVKNSKTIGQLNKALDRIDELVARKFERKQVNKVKKVLKDTKQRIKKIRSGKVKSKLDSQIANRLEEYVNQFEAISQFSQKDLRELYERMDDGQYSLTAEDLALIQKHSKRDLNSMTAQELVDVMQEIEQIKKEGRLAWEVDEQKEQEELAKIDKELSDVIAQPVEDYFMKAAGLDRSKARNIVTRIKDKAFWSSLRPWTITNLVTGYKSDILKKQTFDKIHQAEITKLQNLAKRKQEFKERYKDVLTDMNSVLNKVDTIVAYTNPNDGKTYQIPLTLNNMMFIYANTKNENNYKHLIATLMGDTTDIDPEEYMERREMAEETLADIIGQLDNKYKKVVDEQIRDYDNNQWSRINKVFEKMMGIKMSNENNYFPINDLERSNPENDIVKEYIARMSTASGAGTEKGFTNMRTGSSNPFANLDYFGTVIRNMNQTEHYIAYADSVRWVNRVLKNTSIQKQIKNFSPDAYQELVRWLNDSAVGRITGAQTVTDQISDIIRNNFAVSVLGGNMVTIMKQVPSYVQGMSNVDKRYWLEANMAYVKNPNQLNSFVNEKSTMMANRKGTEQREFAEMMEKGMTLNTLGAEVINGKLPDSAKQFINQFNKAKKSTREFMLSGIQQADKTVTNIVWYGKYLEVFNETLDEQKAIAEADKVIMQTQPQGGLIYLPGVFRKKGIAKLFTMFRNQPNQNWNNLVELSQTPGMTVEKFKKLTALMIISPALLYMSTNPDWERFITDPEGYLLAMLNNIVSGVPMFGDLANAFGQTLSNVLREARGAKKIRRFAPSAELSPLQDMYDIAGLNFSGSRHTALARLAGVPYPRAARIGLEALAQTGYKALTDKDLSISRSDQKAIDILKDPESPWADKARVLFWSPAAFEDVSVSMGKAQQLLYGKKEDKAKAAEWYRKQSRDKKDEVINKAMQKYNLSEVKVKKRIGNTLSKYKDE